MLIKVFGIWLMTAQINSLDPSGGRDDHCLINFTSSYARESIPHTCDEVAAEINKQIKEQK